MGALAIAVVALAGVLVVSEDPPPGNPAVYERIGAMTDCVELQAEFDRAMGNHNRSGIGTEARRWTLAYARTADKRMSKVGCYG